MGVAYELQRLIEDTKMIFFKVRLLMSQPRLIQPALFQAVLSSETVLIKLENIILENAAITVLV